MASKVKKTKILPPVVVVVFMIAMYAMHRYFPLMPIFDTRWPGLFVMSMAILGVLYCAYLFRLADTSIKPFTESSKLIQRWPYSQSRNPIYVFMAIFLIGFSIWLQTLSPLILIPFFMLWIHCRFILQEEIMLEKQFGDAYLAYKNQVRRWF